MSNRKCEKSTRNDNDQFTNKNVIQKLFLKKFLFSIIATILIVTPFLTYIQSIEGNSSEDNLIKAASLAEVQLLTDVRISAELENENPPDGEPYSLNLGLTGTGLADAEIANPNRVVVFNIPELAGNMQSTGQATVTVEILPITMEDLPALDNTVGGLTETLSTTVGEVLGVVDRLQSSIIPSFLLTIEGISELETALASLNNVDGALTDALQYNDTVDVQVNDDGTVVVNFSDGLGNHLDTTVNDVVIQLLNDVVSAIEGVELAILPGAEDIPGVGLIIGGLNDAVNGVLSTLTSVAGDATDLVEEIANGTVDLTSDLASAQLIGNTTVDLNLAVDNPAGVNGAVPVYGAGINSTVINAQLLSSITDQSDIIFDEDASDPVLNSANIDGNSTDGYNVTGEAQEPGDDVVVYAEDGTVLNRSPVAATGTYAIDLAPGSVEIGANITVQAVDEAGNTSEPLTLTVPDDPDDTAPILDPADIEGTTETGYTVSGTGEEPGDTVNVFDSEGVNVGTSTIDENGNYAIDIEGDAVDVGEELTIIAVDEAENESDPQTVTVPEDPDTTAPVLDSAEIDGDSESGYVVSGTGEEPGDTVNVFDSENTNVGTGIIDDDGNYAIDIEGDTVDAGEELTIIAVDEAENESDPQTVTVPVLQILSVPDTISFQTTEITNGERIIGRAGEEYTIEIQDTRNDKGWSLSAQADPLKNNNNTLYNALYYFQDNNEILIENEQTEVASKNMNDNSDIQTISWSEDEGILLKVNPIEASTESAYSTTIEWTLTNGPQD